MPITWQNVRVNNSIPPMNLEAVYRRFCAYGGLHDLVFDPVIWETGDDLDNFDVVDNWQASGGKISITSASDHNELWHTSTDVPSSGLATFTKDSSDVMAFIFAGDGERNYYFYWVSDALQAIGKTLQLSRKLHTTIPVGVDGEADIAVAWRVMTFNNVENDIELCVSVWVDGAYQLSHTFPLEADALPGTRVGFFAYSGATITIDNFRVPELTRFVDWISLDPGEAPRSGLQRAVGNSSKLRAFVRWDGSMKVWYPKVNTSVHTLNEDATYARQKRTDIREVVTHARVVGGLYQADHFRSDLIAKYGHRFTEFNSPYLNSKEECYDEAVTAIQRSEEALDTIMVEGPGIVLLEPEDHITVENWGDYIVNSISATATGPELTMRAECRAYIYGS